MPSVCCYNKFLQTNQQAQELRRVAVKETHKQEKTMFIMMGTATAKMYTYSEFQIFLFCTIQEVTAK